MNKRITKIEDAAATVDKLAGELLTPADHFYKLRTYDCGVGEIMRSLHEDTQRMFLHLMDLFRLDRELKHKNEKPDPKTKNLAWYLECEFKDLIALSRLPELHADLIKARRRLKDLAFDLDVLRDETEQFLHEVVDASDGITAKKGRVGSKK